MEKKYWVFLGLLAIAVPLGILLPIWLNAGDAWGEWSIEVVKQHIGYEPAGMKKVANVYHAPIPDYNFFDEKASVTSQVLAYLISAFLGVGMILLLTFGLQKIVKRKNDSSFSATTQ